MTNKTLKMSILDKFSIQFIIPKYAYFLIQLLISIKLKTGESGRILDFGDFTVQAIPM